MKRSRVEAVLASVLTVWLTAGPACVDREPAGAGPSTAPQEARREHGRPLAVKPAPPNCPACAMGLTAESIFKRLDVNEDRKISAGEFARSPGIRDAEEARQAVGRIDTDEDGTLSWKEFEAAHKLRHAKCKKALATTAPAGPGQRGNMNRFVQVFIMRSDKNGDGKIDKSEFRGSDSRFERMDKNRNGYIDPEELAELHKRRMNDPKTMRERLESGEVRRPPPWARPEGAGQPRDDDGTEKAPGK